MKVYVVFNCYDFAGIFSSHDKAMDYIKRDMERDRIAAEELGLNPLYSLDDYSIKEHIVDSK